MLFPVILHVQVCAWFVIPKKEKGQAHSEAVVLERGAENLCVYTEVSFLITKKNDLICYFRLLLACKYERASEATD